MQPQATGNPDAEGETDRLDVAIGGAKEKLAIASAAPLTGGGYRLGPPVRARPGCGMSEAPSPT